MRPIELSRDPGVSTAVPFSRERRAGSPLPAASAAFFLTLAYLIVVPSATPAKAIATAFLQTETILWCVLVAAQVAIWSYLAAPAYARVSRYLPALRSHTRQVAADFLSLAPLMIVFWYAHHSVDSSFILPVPYHAEKVPVLLILGFLTIAPCLIGMRLIAITARSQPVEPDGGVAALERFVQLRADLRWFLAGAAAIISAATFANGAFQNALNALNKDKQLPPTEVLLYGGFCSAVLALFYLASHDAFRRSAWAIITAESAHEPTTAAWADAQEKKARLADLLGLRISGVQVLRDSSVIAGPLLGSACALLLA